MASQQLFKEIRQVEPGVISRIAKQVFGSKAVVNSISEIRPTSDQGIPRIVGCNANLSYIIDLVGHSQRYVFRFSRGYRGDQFEREAKNYGLIAEKTDIPTPRIYAVDRTVTIAPAPYMIMDWMPGDTWKFLSHARNSITNPEEKREIEGMAGFCYAQIHSIEREASTPRQGTERLLYRLDQLCHVVQDGQFSIEMNKLDRCREVIDNDDSLHSPTESVCVNDAELYFLKTNGQWKPSFICDMEWVDFGDPYLDLAMLCMPKDVWELTSLFSLEAADSAVSRPFFKGYEEKKSIDYDRLSKIAAYAHFSCMCSITDQLYRKDKRALMKSLEPKYVAIVDGILAMSGTPQA